MQAVPGDGRVDLTWQAPGLASALTALAQKWKPALAVTVSNDEASSAPAQASITRREGRIRVQIADDGSGFDTASGITGTASR